MDLAVTAGDDDLSAVDIGAIFLDALPMLEAFQAYCTKQVRCPILSKPNLSNLSMPISNPFSKPNLSNPYAPNRVAVLFPNQTFPTLLSQFPNQNKFIPMVSNSFAVIFHN